ncbi:uncharacterized protein LOC109601364 isoform X2 [Aethina tumida]|uniref:uncharacterized protein LOC109601364 isoform X2 n=1 Tax=Aethina tumida TaxID=116153 RepID=UPI0021497B27|nr:uncharacterized protein LOC109601364 isoform X2 [Aethina tumida]
MRTFIGWDDPNQAKNQKFHHRTPWAKMKDIISTRNSFKKKHRLSAQSDDIQIDIELCSDNEDVFVDDNKSKSLQSSTPSPCSTNYIRCNSNDIPHEVILRYQQAMSEDALLNGTDGKKISKWVRVKKAFLSHNVSNFTEKENIQAIEDEIQNNYRKLQKKLSLEFHEKRSEWERMKQSSPSTSNTPSSCMEDNKDPAFAKKMEEWQKIKSNNQKRANIHMTKEIDLPPEFKKKMDEWERIKKLSAKEQSSKKKLGEVPRWKSLSGHRSETSTAIEMPPLSDDFKKKLEEWRQIKASGGTVGSEAFGKKLKDKTPSPKLSRKNSSPKHSKKSKEHLTDIDKESRKGDKQHRSSKSGKNSAKQDVLVNTPSGFIRFEGISRQFTRKLYEWEKARGISPKSSTFALLTSSTPENKAKNSPPLIRCKSADSIAKSVSILTCPIMSHQPSSLSLNDMEDFGKESISGSKSSLIHYLNSQDDLDNDEPEALIVEVEDYVEETAAPLKTFIEEQKPIYQREEIKAMCEGETVAAPKVRRSESAKAQNNYNIIEEIFIMLSTLLENEQEIKKLIDDGSYMEPNKNSAIIQENCQKEKIISERMTEQILKLQEANTSVISSISKNECSSKLSDTLEAVHELSTEINEMSEALNKDFNHRIQICNWNEYSKNHSFIDTILDIRSKMMELRRHLSYVCASSDLTAPGRKRSSEKKSLTICKSLSNDSKDSRCDTSDNSRQNSEKKSKEGRFIKSETCNVQSQGAVKKRIKYRQKSIQNRSLPDTDEEDNDIIDQRKNKPKKLGRTRSTSENSGSKTKVSDSEEPPLQLDLSSIIVPTETNYVTTPSTSYTPQHCESPVTLFVKTTRKLFTPIGETNLSVDNAEIKVSDHDKIATDNKIEENEIFKKSLDPPVDTVTHLPPLPSSPVPQRKPVKDVSPSIRLIMAKYNQKISEQETTTPKSGGSSGSASPIAWRSPTAERRVKAQTEKYQEELLKMSPLLGGRREVQKSASVGYINTSKQITVPVRKTSMLSNMFYRPTPNSPKEDVKLKPSKTDIRKSLTLNLDLANEPINSQQSPELRSRSKMIQKAKEEFLNSPVSAPARDSEALKFPTRNRLSQISVDSESSCDTPCAGALIKSASAGMINIDPDTYKQFDPEYHTSGYVSLPRSAKKPKEGLLGTKFAFSNIASKFRKVRMRRGKDKMNAVSTLCRQSLVVDISPSDEAARLMPSPSAEASSGDVSPSSSRSGSWIKKPKLFRR